MSEPSADTRTLWRDGLWHNNPALVQLLGLCPLLAVSNTVINALALGLITTAVWAVTNTVSSLARHWLAPATRLPMLMLLIASAVTAADIGFAALSWELHRELGVFIPLIVTNCAILARAEAFATRHPPRAALIDGLAMGLGFTGALLALGAVREALGRGSLLAGAEQLFGPAAADWAIPMPGGFLLAVLPAGAFVALGLLLAARQANWRLLSWRGRRWWGQKTG